LTSTNHAKMYGLYPQKGSIGPGFDADIVLWEPKRKETISQAILHHGSDYTPYEGLRVTGWACDDAAAQESHRRRRQNSRGKKDGQFSKGGSPPMRRRRMRWPERWEVKATLASRGIATRSGIACLL
jgi:hypothetical protein